MSARAGLAKNGSRWCVNMIRAGTELFGGIGPVRKEPRLASGRDQERAIFRRKHTGKQLQHGSLVWSGNAASNHPDRERKIHFLPEVLHLLRDAVFEHDEDGVPQKVKYLWQEMDLPLTVGVVGCCIATPHQRAVLELFSRMLSPEDRAFPVSAGSQPRLLTDWTNSAE